MLWNPKFQLQRDRKQWKYNLKHKNQPKPMAEGIYIVEQDRNDMTDGGIPTIWGGPYSNEIDAEEEVPEDEDGMEYTIEYLDDFQASLML